LCFEKLKEEKENPFTNEYAKRKGSLKALSLMGAFLYFSSTCSKVNYDFLKVHNIFHKHYAFLFFGLK
jgi:hypothetical protein